MKPAKRETTKEPPKRTAVETYISQLQVSFGAFARPAGETRRIVDASMGKTRLTDLLYESRKDE